MSLAALFNIDVPYKAAIFAALNTEWFSAVENLLLEKLPASPQKSQNPKKITPC